MITQNLLTTLSRYKTSSWAIWNPKWQEIGWIDDYSFFLNEIDKFHGNVIFVGLNPSEPGRKKMSDPKNRFLNFHNPSDSNNQRLKRYIQDNHLDNLVGGFMTDLSDEFNSNSNDVKINRQQSLDNLFKKIKSIPIKGKNRKLIFFGVQSFKDIRMALGIKPRELKKLPYNIKKMSIQVENEKWELFGVWHYTLREYGDSDYGNKANIEELEKQLQYLNQK